MSKQIVILYNELETMIDPPVVTLFDEIHNPIPYIRRLLQNWDIYNEKFLRDLNNIETVEDAITLIEEYKVRTIQILVIKEVNPKG